MTVIYRDTTYCASPHCQNKCGRKLTPEQEATVKLHNIELWYGYFCGEPEKYKKPLEKFVELRYQELEIINKIIPEFYKTEE